MYQVTILQRQWQWQWQWQQQFFEWQWQWFFNDVLVERHYLIHLYF